LMQVSQKRSFEEIRHHQTEKTIRTTEAYVFRRSKRFPDAHPDEDG
jgi:hypothetical protein